jgi:site-specific DNA-cytosine methylase
LAVHRVNHPETEHYCEDVWKVDPKTVCRGRAVGSFWLSPDCTFHSRARGGRPFRDRRTAHRTRGLAWLAIHWAKEVAPRIIRLENVCEFADWGPLTADGTPDPMRKGFTFRRFVKRLQNLGYEVEWRELRACDYGAPTSRERLFLIARRDRRPIIWPELPTVGGFYRIGRPVNASIGASPVPRSSIVNANLFPPRCAELLAVFASSSSKRPTLTWSNWGVRSAFVGVSNSLGRHSFRLLMENAVDRRLVFRACTSRWVRWSPEAPSTPWRSRFSPSTTGDTNRVAQRFRCRSTRSPQRTITRWSPRE